MDHIVIIGNGIAGITAARHIRKLSNHKISVISSETDHFFSRTALMYIYMGHMKYEHTKPYADDFWAKNWIELKNARVEKIDIENKTLHFTQPEIHTPLPYDKLVLALGSQPNFFGWPGQDLKGVQGLYSFQDLESMERDTNGINHAVIVGGGLIGIEMAEMLHSRGIHTTFLVRESSFWDNVLSQEESAIINSEILDHGIDLRLSTELKEILPDENGRVKAVVTSEGESIPCQFVGLTAGVAPNIALVKNSPIETDKGILVDEFLQTNIKGIYAIGDCAQLKSPMPHRRAIEQVWYTGRMMGETLAQTLTGKPTAYQPGVWFNSAKFFEIEYQTYGSVPPILPKDESTFYWECTDHKKCLRINFRTSDATVTGMNVLGIRMRHETWDKWIRQRATLKEVLQNLGKANFDPEFFHDHTIDIQKHYNRHFPDNSIKKGKVSLLQKILS